MVNKQFEGGKVGHRIFPNQGTTFKVIPGVLISESLSAHCCRLSEVIRSFHNAISRREQSSADRN